MCFFVVLMLFLWAVEGVVGSTPSSWRIWFVERGVASCGSCDGGMGWGEILIIKRRQLYC